MGEASSRLLYAFLLELSCVQIRTLVRPKQDSGEIREEFTKKQEAAQAAALEAQAAAANRLRTVSARTILNTSHASSGSRPT